MEHAHYVVLFAGLIFGNNPAANDRSGAPAANRDDWISIEPVSTKVEQSSTKLFGVSPFLTWGRLNLRRTAMKLHLIAIAATVDARIRDRRGVRGRAAGNVQNLRTAGNAIDGEKQPFDGEGPPFADAFAGTNRVERPQQTSHQPDGAGKLHGRDWRHDPR